MPVFGLKLPTILALLALAAPALAQPARAVSAAWADAQRLPPSLQCDTAYLWVHKGDAKDRRTAWEVNSGIVHIQNRNRPILPPLVILADGSLKKPLAPAGDPLAIAEADWANVVLIRVQLGSYQFSRKVWDELGFQDHIFHLVRKTPTSKTKDGEPIWQDLATGKWFGGAAPAEVLTAAPWLTERAEDSAAMLGLMLATKSVSPILRADNFAWQISISKDRRVGFYGLMEVKDLRSYERTIGFDPKADVNPGFFDEVLAAVSGAQNVPNPIGRSGVAQKNRRIDRRQGFSAYWTTRDQETITNVENNPLRTLNGGLKFPAIETYGHNACGMWVPGLFVGNQPKAGQKAGDRQDSAPDFIGYNHLAATNDGRIHNGLSCYACHTNGGLQDISCWFRNIELFRPLQTIDPRRLKDLDHYRQPLEPLLAADRARYAISLKEATGLTPEQFASKWVAYFNAYDAGVTVERGAEDIGISVEELIKRLDAFVVATKQGDTVISAWQVADPKRRAALSLDDWHQTYNVVQLAIRGLAVWPEKPK